MSLREHTNREYEGELRKLRDQLLRMGAKVEEIISGSIKALLERDTDLATRMIAFDRRINQMEVDIDGLCLSILARRQPVASDLRFITMALKLVTDLERIGDLGVNISERVVELNAEPPLKPYVDLPNMANEVQGMLREALDAFVAGDPERAHAVIERDTNIDAYYSQIFRELLTYMMEDAHNIFRATRLQSIAKYLERIGDHATNVAEMVVFMVKGMDIRHTGKLEGETARRRLNAAALTILDGHPGRVPGRVPDPSREEFRRQSLPPVTRSGRRVSGSRCAAGRWRHRRTRCSAWGCCSSRTQT